MQILCATDFSPDARAAADVAAAFARKMNLPLRLVHCAPLPVAMGESVVDMLDPVSARQDLTTEAERLRRTGCEVNPELRRGHPPAEVAAAAMEQPTELVVVGRPETLFAHPSVAIAATKGFPAPTLVVRHSAPLLKWLGDGQPLTILCGVDFTVSADAAVASLRELCRLAPVLPAAAYISSGLAQADPGDETTQGLQRDIWERLHHLLGTVPELAEVPLKIHIRPAVKRPADEFVDLAKEEGADLLLVGAHQLGGIEVFDEGLFRPGSHSPRRHQCALRAASPSPCPPATACDPPCPGGH